MHPEVEALLEPVRVKMLELHEALVRCGEAPDLPDYDAEAVAKYRSWVRWDAFAETTEASSASSKPWISPEIQEELDAIEARLAAELRSRKELS